MELLNSRSGAVALLAMVLALPAAAAPAGDDQAPVLSWHFDEGVEDASNPGETWHGPMTYVPGVRGQALILDGQTTYLVRPAPRVPDLGSRFTVQGFVALGAYPFRQAPLVDLYDPEHGGVFVGFDHRGRLQLVLRAGGREQTVTATTATPLRHWHHVAAVFSGHEGALYLDGKPVGEGPIEGAWAPAAGLDLLVGRHRFAHRPVGTIRPQATAEVHDMLDAAIDSVDLYARSLSAEEIREAFARETVPARSPLPTRVLPAGPPGPGAFGAFYTRLDFYPQWDAPWRVGNTADVVVRFDRLPGRLVFWHGAGYVPNWVTENGIWYNNEFNETWTGVQGCGEPMSDKQARYSHVRVIETNDARAVVHWRYALGDVFYTIARTDPETGWGDWSDEVYTIYPDGVAVRDVTLHSSHPEEPHEWQESIVVMSPGMGPNDALEPAAVTIAGAAQGGLTYSWQDAVPPKRPADAPLVPSIQVVNTKSRLRPFALMRPQDRPTFDIFASEVRRDDNLFPWWNHWPASVIPSDGRHAYAADRPSHTSLTHLRWEPYEQGPGFARKIMIAGLTERPPEALRTTLDAWSRPAELAVDGDAFASEGFDPAQRAYVLAGRVSSPGPMLSAELRATTESPVANPALVIRNWGEAAAELWLDGQPVPRGPAFRYGHRRTLDGTDLIVWIERETSRPLRLRLAAPAGAEP